MSNYEISVVTPYHNIDPKIFKNGLESIKNQTIGFENIEWVIVLHNCEDKYIMAVEEMTAPYENIRTFVLNNDCRTPSSPRNYGMRMATSKYLAFLDGDDSFTPWCFKKVLSHMKRSKAEITWFRREFELENPTNVPVTEIVLWDQTREEIIIEPDNNWDDEKMFSGVWGLVTSRIYDREFLERNNIWFDESVGFAEDYLFNLQAYPLANRLCYLPQTIGYHYFINSGSLVQSGEKSGEDIINIANGLTKVFDACLSNGYYADPTIGAMIRCVMRFMVASKKITLDDRYKIRDILGPYIEKMKPLKISKIYSERAAYERYDIPKDYIMNISEGKDGDDAIISKDIYGSEYSKDMKVLKKILDDNCNTDIGKRYDFVGISTLSGFEARVPVTDYDTYQPLIALTTRIGESQIFVSEPITNYLYSFGSFNTKKILPCTKEHIKEYSTCMSELFKNNDTALFYESVTSIVHYNDNTSLNSIYAAIMQDYFSNLYNQDKEANAEFAIPSKLIFDDEMASSFDIRWVFAINDEKLTQIVAPNTWNIYMMFDHLFRNIDKICDAIKNGQIENYKFMPDATRAEYIRDMLKKAKNGEVKLDVKKIWPEFKRVVAFKDNEFTIYTDYIMENFDNIVVYNAPLLIPEVFMGMSVDGSSNIKLNCDNAFLEFKKCDENGMPEDNFVFISGLEIGNVYKVFVTTHAGLYRYNTNRFIKVVAIEDETPVFTWYDEAVSKLKIANSTIKSIDLYRMIKEACNKFYIPLSDYAYTEENDGFVIYIEPQNENVDMNITKAIKEELEIRLKKEIDSYEKDILDGSINELEVRLLEPQTMTLYAETKASKLDVTTDSIYPSHVLTAPRDKKFLKISAIK